MFLTSENLVGGRDRRGIPEDLSFINDYHWQSSRHMKEAIKILLSARLDGKQEFPGTDRFGEEKAEEQDEVQIRLAANPETSVEVLSYLGRIGNKAVCERVALNPRCGEEALEYLSKHHDADVRAAVSENKKAPFPVLLRLAKDTHPDVRFRLAENANLPNTIIEELCQDENPFVADRALQTLKCLQKSSLLEPGPGFWQTSQSLYALH